MMYNKLGYLLALIIVLGMLSMCASAIAFETGNLKLSRILIEGALWMILAPATILIMGVVYYLVCRIFE
jgi:hypothetical protein